MAPEEVKESTVGLPVGERIGKYEICQKLGTGGQAIVYKCYDAMLDRFVAIKQISSHLAEDPKFLERFRKEAQILAKLGQEQPAIVTIHELLEEPTGLFIVMEFVEGHTLERILRENPGPIEAKAVLQILWRLAAALHVVHATGIIHRDIKPGNIIIGEGLRAKITDFGVAASLTGQTSMLLGTTKYMAPELFAGEPADGRADMYSLGFITYEMLLGREKFNEIFHDVVRDPHSEALRWMKWHGNEHVSAPSADQVNPAVPPALGDIVARMIAKDPAERFESMEALGRAVKSAFSPRGRAAAGPRARRTARVPVVPVVQPVGAAAAPPAEGGEELEIDRDATAPIPKKTMSLRVKLILGGVVALCAVIIGIVLLVRAHQEAQRVRLAARTHFDAAWKLYEQKHLKKPTSQQRRAAYEDALKRLEALRQPPFHRAPESAKAFVIVPVCRARLAILKARNSSSQDDWSEAQVQCRKATDNLKELKRQAKRGTDLARFADAFTDDVEKLVGDVQNEWEFGVALGRAEDLFKNKASDDALKIMEEQLRRSGLSRENKDTANKFVAKVRQTQFRIAVRTEIDRGHTAARQFLELVKQSPTSPAAQGQFEIANSSYQRASTMLDSDEARVLEDHELSALKQEVAEGKKTLTSASGYYRLLVEAAEAKQAGDKAKELKILEQIVKIKSSDAHQARIRQIETELVYAQILGYIDTGRPARAIRELEKFVKDHPEHADAAALLKNLTSNRERQILIVQGERAMKERNYAEAKAKFEKARTLQADPALDKKIRLCQYNMDLAKADAAYQAKEYVEAEALYSKMLQAYTEHAPVMQARLVALQRVVRYLSTLARIKKAIASGQYDEARGIIKRELTPPTPEALQLRKLSFYLENRDKGKSEIARAQYLSAVGYLNIAKGYAQTPEEAKEIAELLARAQKLAREHPEEVPAPTP